MAHNATAKLTLKRVGGDRGLGGQLVPPLLRDRLNMLESGRETESESACRGVNTALRRKILL